MFLQFQWQGYLSAVQLGVQEDDRGWQYAGVGFFVSEHVFNAVYLIEFMFRMRLMGVRYFRGMMNKFDFALVFISSLDLYVIQNLEGALEADVTILRFVRFLKVARALRIVRTVS